MSDFTEAEVTEALMAVIAWAGNCAAAHRSLKAKGKRVPSASTLTNWTRELHAARFNELRDKYSEQLEGQLINEYRDVARMAMDVQRRGLEKALDGLEAGTDKDPSRTASNAATVADKATRDMLSLSGRPTSIREDRNLEEVLRSLVAKKVIALPEEVPSVPSIDA